MKKLLALLLCLVSIVSVFVGCAKEESDEIVLPKQVVEETYENRVAALMETALAFYRKNPYVQYDSMKMTVTDSRSAGVRNADRYVNTPEMAGPQRTIYHVCSFFTSTCTYHTFGYEEQGSWENHAITPMAVGTREDIAPYVAYQVNLNDLTEAQKLEELEKFLSVLQPGDMIYYVRNKGTVNHTVMWADDLTGDGVRDIIHVGGDYYELETKTDVREEEGAVYINNHRIGAYNAEQFFADPKVYDYFPKLKNVGVIRYADAKHAANLPLTEAAKTRFLFPGLTIYFEAEQGIYGAVEQGGEYTFTLTVYNESQQDHKGLLLQLPVPVGGEIVKINGEPAKNKTIKCQVDIPAGEAVTLNYTVKATGEVGSLVETGVGYVHAIPLPNLTATVVSAKPAADTVKSAISAATGKNGDEFLAAYLTAMGYEPFTLEQVQTELFVRKNVGALKLRQRKDAADVENKTLYAMQIPEYFGGRTVMTKVDSLRVKELRAQDLQTGDILLWQESTASEPMVAVHDGENLLMARNGSTMPAEQWKLDEFLAYDFFIALRPTQVL